MVKLSVAFEQHKHSVIFNNDFLNDNNGEGGNKDCHHSSAEPREEDDNKEDNVSSLDDSTAPTPFNILD